MPDQEIVKRGRGRPRKVIAPDTITVPETKQDHVIRSDDWSNFYTGLGQVQDKSTHTVYRGATLLDDGTLFEMYLGDGLASRIVDIVSDDMTREWIYLPDEQKRDILNPEMERLNAEEAFNTAIKWQRLYGGGLILIGAMDGRALDQPLNEKAIRSIEYLHPIDRTCVNIQESIIDTNPESPTFTKILKYKVRYYINNNVVDMFVHASRVLEFKNDPMPTGTLHGLDKNIQYWGISSLQKINEALRDLGGITQTTVNILMDFVSGTFKFKGLGQLLAAGNEALLVKRMQAINLSRSVINATILDSEESYDRQYTTVAGLPELIDRYMLQLSGSTGIPVTRLYGRSPAGLNATGENDTRNYYDLIEAQQRNRLLPPLRRLITLMCLWKKLDPQTEIEFNSLYQLSEEEKSKIAKIDAETAEIEARTQLAWIDAGIRDGYEVAKEMGWESEYEEIEEPVEATIPPVADDTEPEPKDIKE